MKLNEETKRTLKIAGIKESLVGTWDMEDVLSNEALSDLDLTVDSAKKIADQANTDEVDSWEDLEDLARHMMK